MANTRLERIGTIFSRVKGLIKGGGLKPENRPMWFDIYETFPPRYEPNFSRAAEDITIKPIFYEEDIVRAKFYDSISRKGTFSFIARSPSSFEYFMSEFEKCKKLYPGDEEKAFSEAMNNGGHTQLQSTAKEKSQSLSSDQ